MWCDLCWLSISSDSRALAVKDVLWVEANNSGIVFAGHSHCQWSESGLSQGLSQRLSRPESRLEMWSELRPSHGNVNRTDIAIHMISIMATDGSVLSMPVLWMAWAVSQRHRERPNTDTDALLLPIGLTFRTISKPVSMAQWLTLLLFLSILVLLCYVFSSGSARTRRMCAAMHSKPGLQCITSFAFSFLPFIYCSNASLVPTAQPFTDQHSIDPSLTWSLITWFSIFTQNLLSKKSR